MRISRGRLGAVVGVLAVVIVAVLLVRGGGDDDESRIVRHSSLGAYPTRGSLIDNQKLLEGAAQAWRDETRDEDESASPANVMSVLYASRVSGEKVATGPDRDLAHDVVVLFSRSVIGTVIRPKGGDWDVTVTQRFNPWSVGRVPVLDVGAGLYLVAAQRFGETAQAVALPRQVKDDEEVRDGATDPALLAVDLRDPLWAPGHHAGPLALRLPGEKDGTYVGQVWLNLASSSDVDAPLVTRTAGGEGADDRLWQQLVSPAHAAGTSAAFEAAIEALRLRYPGREFDSAVPDGFSIRALGTAALRGTPDGDQVAHGLALGHGVDGDADVVAVGLTGKDGEGVVRTRGVVLGQRPTETPEAVAVAATWITADDTGANYLMYAADPALKRLQLRVGSKPVDTDGFLGYYAPPGPGDADRPTATLIGYDKVGDFFASFPIGTR